MTTEDGLGVLAITHYARLLTELRPDRGARAHGRPRSSRAAAPSSPTQLEETGYEGLAAALGVEAPVEVAARQTADPFADPGF